MALTFTDAGVASGEMSGSISAQLFGAASIIGLTGLSTSMDSVTRTALYESLSLDVLFNAAGAITGENLDRAVRTHGRAAASRLAVLAAALVGLVARRRAQR